MLIANYIVNMTQTRTTRHTVRPVPRVIETDHVSYSDPDDSLDHHHDDAPDDEVNEVMAEESPDGRAPSRSSRLNSWAALYGLLFAILAAGIGLGLAFGKPLLALASIGITALVIVAFGLPAIAAGMLRKEDRDHAESEIIHAHEILGGR